MQDDWKADWKRNATLFLASQAVSLFGSTLVELAIIWYITLSTQSGSMMTLSILFGFLPTFMVSPFAGVWADRFDRKLLIGFADMLIALFTLILAILFILGYRSVWLLFAASAVRSACAGIQMPAVGAFLPQFVPHTMLTRINAINSVIQSTTTLIAPMLSALLLTIASIEAIFFIDVVTAALAVTILFRFLQVPARQGGGGTRSTNYFEDLREGVAYIGRHGFLKAFFVLTALGFCFQGPLAFLTPLQVARTYGEEVWRLSAIEVGFSLGMILGGVLLTRWRGLPNKVYRIVLANAIFGVCAVICGLPPSFSIYVLMMGICGIFWPMFNTATTVFLQERVADAFLGRIFGVNTMIASSLMPLSMLVYGPLADVTSVERLMLITGVLLVAQSLLMLAHGELRRAGEPVAAQPS